MKKLFTFVLTLVLVFGLFQIKTADAAWWNPLSWFHTTTVQVNPAITPIITPIASSTVPLAGSTMACTPRIVQSACPDTSSALQAQITTLTNQLVTANASLAALSSANASQAARITALSAQLQATTTVAGSTTAAAPKTKDQLQAQYQVSTPLKSCSTLPETGDSRSDSIQCNNYITSYYATMNAWINAQLAAQ